MTNPYAPSRWGPVRARVLLRDGYRCQIVGPTCTGVADRVDHIVPVSAGGAWYELSNLRAACAACNSWRARRRVEVSPSRVW